MTNKADFAICTVAFGQQYTEQQARLINSIYDVYGPDQIPAIFKWTNELPKGSKAFLDSIYGFKVWAVNAALVAGYERIFWLDTAVILQKPLDYYLDLVGQFGVLAVADENLLPGYCDDRTYKHFNISIDKSTRAGHRLVGGSFYYFDFSIPLCGEVYAKWMRAETFGIFGNQDDMSAGKINRCRWDESAMALSLYTSGTTPVPTRLARYNGGENSILIKKHFK